ncbi:MAG: hypothetical protein WC375_10685 [Methanomassiliicoccales archaeon]|jgi:hypothetical protein
MDLISLKKMPKEAKISILIELGYGSDGTFVIGGDGSRIIDPYIQEPVKLDNMLILPGSTIVLDNNPLSVASYFEDHGDIL